MELSEIKNMDDAIIILGLDERYHLEVLDHLYGCGWQKHIFPHNGIGFRDFIRVVEYENGMTEEAEFYSNLYGYEQWIRREYE